MLRKACKEADLLGKGILMITLPEKAKAIIKTLEEKGYEAYAVGGCIRDSLRGRRPHDWDITTSAMPEEVRRLFKRTVDTGMKHGTVTVLLGDDAFEVTTYRVDGEYLDGRHPESVTFTGDLLNDLKRRDFTINAMAYNEKEGLIDSFGGQEDLAAGVIRAVGDPEERFQEDALRILRAVRFAAQLDFHIDKATRAAAEKASGSLRRISAERIRDELLKLITSDHPEKLRDCYELGMTAAFLPEFDTLMKTPQNTPHHRFSVGEHTISSMGYIAPDTVLRLTMLLHDMGKPACRTTDESGRDHFYGHPEKSAVIADEVLRRLKLDNVTRHKVVQLVRFHDYRPKLSEAAVRRAVVKCGRESFPALFLVREADTLAQSEYYRSEKLQYIQDYRELYEKIIARGDCLTVRDLALSGKDLIEMGYEPGPGLGRKLDGLLAAVLEDPSKNSREELKQLLKSV